MQRRKFIKTACIGAACCMTGGSALIQGCGTAVYYAEYQLTGRRLAVEKSAFQFTTKKGELHERMFVLVKPTGAAFPISIYHGPEGYTACLLRCSHQACEVEVQGSRYACPCHGSEFDIHGTALNGPADQPLQTFKIEENETQVFILLP